MLRSLVKTAIEDTCTRYAVKLSEIQTKLQPHQQRVVDRLQQSDQPGLVVIHGLGSGKTLSSIAAQDALGLDATTVVPAALQANYQKEQLKHTGANSGKLMSMQNAAVKGEIPQSDMLIVDEAHRARDPGSKTFRALAQSGAKKRMLLTGSPFYNRPSDISALIDLAANDRVLPLDENEFNSRYITDQPVKPGLMGSLMGVKPGTTPVLNKQHAGELQSIFKKWTDYHPGSTDNFPNVREEDVRVPMTPDQLRVYDTLMKKAPSWVAYKVKHNLPPSKQEAGDLNSFLMGTRQVSNTTQPFSAEGPVYQPKIDAAYGNLKKFLDENPESKGVIYSNFLGAGINPYKKLLDADKIPYGEFTGAMSQPARNDLVNQYNAGKLRALLLSSAGGEGLDLKGTRIMQILDPHWNNEKLRQVQGRGARYMSHAGLPEDQQNLLIQKYLATRPASGPLEKLRLATPGSSVDEYLANLARDKDALNNQFKALLQAENANQAS